MHTFFGLLFIVPQNHAVIIERLGKYSTTKRSGLNFKIPLIDHIRRVDGDWEDVAYKEGVYIEMSEQQTDTPARQCQTRRPPCQVFVHFPGLPADTQGHGRSQGIVRIQEGQPQGGHCLVTVSTL